jgi:hypothetical protein
MRTSVIRKALRSTCRTAEIWSHGIGGRVAAGYALDVTDEGDARARIQKLLVTGDNRLKQGVDPEKVRETYEEALEVARSAGLEESVRPLVEIRLADLDRSS